MKQYPSYLEQNCKLTLAEGLKEYTDTYAFLNKNDGKTEESRWFRHHDVTHVIFGTIPFEVRGEAINDCWTLAGSDMTVKKYMEFFKFVDYDIVINSYLKKYKYKFVVYLKGLMMLPICAVALWRGWRMKKKWPWFDPEPYMQHSLADIRREFGIKLIAYK